MHWHSKAFHHRMAFPLDTTGFNGVHGGWAWLIELGILKAFFFLFSAWVLFIQAIGFFLALGTLSWGGTTNQIDGGYIDSCRDSNERLQTSFLGFREGYG